MTRDARDPGRIDLHMHTNRSDGKLPPDELLAQILRGKLDLAAVADHDLPNVLTPGVHTDGKHSVRILAAAELSGSHAARIVLRRPARCAFARHRRLFRKDRRV